jgi:acetyl-CoA C-acetyltransferase
MQEAVIVSAARTPVGAFQGALKDIPGPKLGAIAIREALNRAKISPEHIDEVLMGSVLTAGVGQAPARQAALGAGLPNSVRCTTVNRVCGSGLKTVMLASQAIACEDARWIVAGGMESMSRTPYLLEKAREGYRLGNGKLIDSLVHDGLWDVYNDIHMGNCAELCAKEKKVSREDQDRYARLSYQRAIDAIQSGKFKKEIVGVEVKDKAGMKLIDSDEEPFRAKLDKFGELKPVFDKAGTVTAANASSLSDGAAALVVTSKAEADRAGVKPIARILFHESHAQAPEWFTTAPVGAIQKLLKKAKLSAADIDLYEINEAFSVVALACVRDLGISEEKVNVRGGAVSLGHPIGASGARILVTLLHALRDSNQRLGVASLCIGGGEASALLVEALY